VTVVLGACLEPFGAGVQLLGYLVAAPTPAARPSKKFSKAFYTAGLRPRSPATSRPHDGLKSF
jgi:hypothetical protein